jgi:peptidylprolyl isomerase/peptidyl-prolyl cis-trans isomerase B (cyclophilin B)
MKKTISILCCIGAMVACKEKNMTGKIVELTTSMGKINIQLYDETPLHRDNFVKLVENHFYDSILFHRVIKGFMIQAGDPFSKHASAGARLGEGSEGELIDAEFVPTLFHKRGALAAARLGDARNPERKSNGSQFYIVQGEVFSQDNLENVIRRTNETLNRTIFQSIMKDNLEEYNRLQTANDLPALDSLERKIKVTRDSLFEIQKRVLTDEQVRVYTSVGGAPHLDGAYTVFGEIISGMEVVDKIAASRVDMNDRPIDNIRIIKAKVTR